MLTVRFAPSPAGHLHIRGARTSIFDWLYAHRNGGRMIPRFRDTNPERNPAASPECIFNGLNWLKLGWGEQYSESERLSADPDFTDASVECDPHLLAEEQGLKAGALTRQAVGPSAFHVFTAISRERAIARLRAI